MTTTQVTNKKVKGDNLALKQFTQSVFAVVLSILIGIVLMAIIDPSYIKSFLHGLYDLSFGSLNDFSNFLANLSWMIPLGLSLAVSFRIGVFNIGSAGQMFAGGFMAFIFATSVNAGPFGWILMLMFGMLIGMLIAMLIAFLKNSFNINEVISSIMFNWVIFYIIKSMAPGAGESWSSMYGSVLDGNALKQQWLLDLFDTNTNLSRINIGIFISLALIPIFAYFYKKTNWGFKQNLLGGNSNTASYLGLNKKSEIMKTMAISGALAGLAGAIFFVGFHTPSSLKSVISASSNEIPGIFFNGITIALLGFNGVWGVLMSSMLLSMLYPGGMISLDQVSGDAHIVDIMIGVMIIMMARAHYSIYYKDKKAKAKKKNSTPSKGGDE